MLSIPKSVIVTLMFTFVVTINYSAKADMEVVESNVPAFAVGAKLDDLAKLNVPDGKSITVLLANGRQQVIKGPHCGSVAQAAKIRRSAKPNPVPTAESADKIPGGTRRRIKKSACE